MRFFIKKFDSKNVLLSTSLIREQILQSLEENKSKKFNFRNISNIISIGMGGSSLGADFIKSVFYENLKVPIYIIRDYNPPKFINKNSLVFLISYSGNTEEVIYEFYKIKKITKKIIIVSSGGKLENLAKRNKISFIKINPINNPCAQPRVGIGYQIGPFIMILKNLNLLDVNINEIKKSIRTIDINTIKNTAKKLSYKLKDKSIIIISSEHFVGNIHIFANQLNETSKQFAFWFTLPEMNHHLLEGLNFPKECIEKYFYFIFIKSKKFYKRTILRYKITQEILKKRKIKFKEIEISGMSRFQESLKLLLLSSFISFYLGILNKIDPSEIPWVNFLKQKLKKF